MSDADVLGAGTGAGPSGQTFRPEPAAFVPGAQWIKLVSGSISVSAAIAVPNGSFLHNDGVNNGIVGPQDGAIIFLAGIDSTKDGGQRIFIWDANSLATGDQVNIYNPWLDGGTPGRWRRLGGSASVTVPRSAAVSLVANTPAVVASLLVPAGDWDAYGTLYLAQSAPGLIQSATGFITTASSFSFDDGLYGANRISFAPGGSAIREVLPLGPIELSSAVPAVVNMWAMPDFGSGTVTGYGTIYVRKAL